MVPVTLSRYGAFEVGGGSAVAPALDLRAFFALAISVTLANRFCCRSRAT